MSLNQYLTTDFHYSLLWKHPDMDNIHNSWLRFQNGVVQRHQRTPQDPPSETEALFEKPLTPSDVGKLNRLVIPKQHAERCFPLATETPSSPSMAAEKGVLLCFEDVDDGKQWRFRYSYWTSSQSYVLTKGWSRYVKEKQLDAGDVVFFHRHRADGRRLFIGWRRQNGVGPAQAVTQSPSVSYGTNTTSSRDYNNHINPLQNYHQSEYLYPGQVGGNQTIEFTGNLRTVRLFGVDLECQPEEDRSEPSTPNHSPQTGDGDRLYLYSNQPYHPS